MTTPDDYFTPRAIFARSRRVLLQMLFVWAAGLLIWLIVVIASRTL